MVQVLTVEQHRSSREAASLTGTLALPRVSLPEAENTFSDLHTLTNSRLTDMPRPSDASTVRTMDLFSSGGLGEMRPPFGAQAEKRPSIGAQSQGGSSDGRALEPSRPLWSSRKAPLCSFDPLDQSTAASSNSATVEEVGQLDSILFTAPDSNPPKLKKRDDIMLCLAFADTSIWSESSLHTSGSFRSNVTSDRFPDSPSVRHSASLMSPIPKAAAGQILQLMDRKGVRPCEEESYPPLRRVLSALGDSKATPAMVLVFLVVLVFLDILVFIITASIMLRFSVWTSVLWFLLPPLAQPFSMVLGPIFAITEDSRWGRLYASMTIFSVANNVVATVIMVLLLQSQSWMYDLLQLTAVTCIKIAQFICAHIHIDNLDAAYDLSFMNTSQADFLRNILHQNSDLTAVRDQVKAKKHSNWLTSVPDHCELLPSSRPSPPVQAQASSPF